MHSQQRGIYRGIFQSTAIFGALRVLTVFLNFARDKALALTLGPAGVGFCGMFDILITTAVSTSSLGVNVSGVREIAASGAKNDQRQLSVAIIAVRRLSQILGATGALVIALFCVPISRMTFGRAGFEIPVLISAMAVFFISLTCAYRAQLQGVNDIRALARATGLAAVTDTVIVVAAAGIWGQPAIAPALALSGLVGAAIFWYAARPSIANHASVSWPEFRTNARRLITLGVGLAIALFFSTYVNYATRVLINRELGLAAAGLYMAAFGLSGKTVGFLLDSMRADLYPRLSAAADDNRRLNELVNGQAEICLLLTVPGILLMIALAPYLLRIFYSNDFIAAAPLLGWFSLGVLARVMSTPLGYVRLAKGRSLLYFLTELGFAALQIVLAFALLKWLGLTGVVVAYMLHATLQTLFLAHTARCLTGFRWSRECMRLVSILIPISVATFGISLFLPPLITAAVGIVLAVTIGCFNVRELVVRLGPEHGISRMLYRIPVFSRLVVPAAH